MVIVYFAVGVLGNVGANVQPNVSRETARRFCATCLRTLASLFHVCSSAKSGNVVAHGREDLNEADPLPAFQTTWVGHTDISLMPLATQIN